MLSATGIRLKTKGGEQQGGFVTTRFVDANSEELAKKNAIKLVADGDKIIATAGENDLRSSRAAIEIEKVVFFRTHLR